MSSEYVEKSNLLYCQEGDLIGLRADPRDPEWFFPPYNTKTDQFETAYPIYSGFIATNTTANSEFLDYQFIYNPKHFLNLEGSQWAVFRKNIRKFPLRNRGALVYEQLSADAPFEPIEDLLIKWAEDKEIYDNEALIKFAFEGENRWGLFIGGKLVGINIFDENEMFVNYRYCINADIPFLNEYLRYAFYVSPILAIKGKMVNDGGSLGSDTLYNFKTKLNPERVHLIYSYGQKDNSQLE